MKPYKLKIDNNIEDDKPIYRYLEFTQFMAMIESGSTYISKISNWDDPWEGVLAKIPQYSSNIKMKIDCTYGQCWSMTEESDALWRIYSPNKQGVAIKSTLDKLVNIVGASSVYIGKVLYFDDLRNVDIKNLQNYEPYLLKRDSFKHENEVRLLIDYKDIKEKDKGIHEKYYNLKLDVNKLLDEVIVDPRAEDWFYSMVKSYCKKNGINNVTKSKLYEDNFEKVII